MNFILILNSEVNEGAPTSAPTSAPLCVLRLYTPSMYLWSGREDMQRHTVRITVSIN